MNRAERVFADALWAAGIKYGNLHEEMFRQGARVIERAFDQLLVDAGTRVCEALKGMASRRCLNKTLLPR